MNQFLNNLKQRIFQELAKAKELKDLDDIYRKYLGKKGELTKILCSLKDLSEKERKEKGRLANQIKREIEDILEQKKAEIRKTGYQRQKDWIDVSAPGVILPAGHLHPISLVRRQIEDIFQSMGFSVVYGPEVENDYYNFDALNTPPSHPARELTDTFWLKLPADRRGRKWLLRTHTSPMQVRYMEKHNPPLRIIVPGRCFRHEATDASHHFQFYQVEGLMVGKDVSLANFKGVVEEFLKRFFGPEIKMRLRPGHFPFTEPSFEVDMRQKGGAWLEIMGAGMVHPKVFKAAGYLPGQWQGFAFGVGLDRLAMIKYQINDIRLFYPSDLRFLKQF